MVFNRLLTCNQWSTHYHLASQHHTASPAHVCTWMSKTDSHTITACFAVPRQHLLDTVRRSDGDRQHLLDTVRRSDGDRQHLLDTVRRSDGDRQHLLDTVRRSDGYRQHVLDTVRRSDGDRQHLLDAVQGAVHVTHEVLQRTALP